jgi:hypothetical protein
LQRARASLAIENGKPVARAAAEPVAGRIVIDATSGQKILELPGAIGGGR